VFAVGGPWGDIDNQLKGSCDHPEEYFIPTGCYQDLDQEFFQARKQMNKTLMQFGTIAELVFLLTTWRAEKRALQNQKKDGFTRQWKISASNHFFLRKWMGLVKLGQSTKHIKIEDKKFPSKAQRTYWKKVFVLVFLKFSSI
jgi:heme/copper-type cytochrome/quinol oxidase subunit 1